MSLLAASDVQSAAPGIYPVPVVNQIRIYWWCSPPRTGRQRMCPVRSTARETGVSFSRDRCVRNVRQQQVTEMPLAEYNNVVIPVGSNRSAVRHIHFAKGSAATWVDHGCPLIEVV